MDGDERDVRGCWLVLAAAVVVNVGCCALGWWL